MADWFTDLVEQESAAVIASQETAGKRALTDRATDQMLADATTGAEEDLRRQFASVIRSVQGLDGDIESAEHMLLAREWNAVATAAQRLELAQRPDHPGQLPGGGRIRQLVRFGTKALSPREAQSAAAMNLATARRAYEEARQARGVTDNELVKIPATRRADIVAALTTDLRSALAIRINAAIDRELEASYERVFSYSGKAELGDPLALAAQPVDTEAFRRLAYLIKDVGSATIGVAGPRGSGKSTLLRQFATTIKDGTRTRRWGLYVPAPARYDARDFLLYLFARLCAEVLGPARTRQVEDGLSSSSPAAAARIALPAAGLAVLAAMALTCWGLVVGLSAARLGESPARMTDLLIACCSSIVALISTAAMLLFGRAQVLTEPGGIAVAFHEPVISGRMRAVLLALAVLATVVAVALFGLLPLGVAPQPAYLAAGALGAAGLAVVSALRLVRGNVVAPTHDGLGTPVWFSEPLYDYAAQWYAKVKFQQTFTTGWSGTITAGAAPFPQLQGGLSGSSEVSALAMPIPEIVERVKEFITVIALNSERWEDELEQPTPVVIGIDEIDKIDDPADAQSFFNQIKGLFGDTSAIFLISISDDAMAAFERRGLPFRDTFDSSLSSVVTLSYLTRAQARKLIGSRLLGVQEPVADLLYVLSGGLARDLVRLIRRAVEARQDGKTDLDPLLLTLISAEADAKRSAVLARARSTAPCPARKKLLDWAGEDSAPADPVSYYVGLLGSAGTLLAAGCPAGCPGDQNADPDSCPAREIGAFLGWLGTTGQIFTTAVSRNDFLAGEAPGDLRSFERLARIRQDFPLGAAYVLPEITASRTSWALPAVPGLL